VASDDPSKAADLSVVVPAFNEEEGIGSVVKGATEALQKAGVRAEILVVDDGSTDRTADRAAEAGARVIRHDVNQGYGSALNTGVRLSGSPHVAIIDGDGTYPTSNLADLSGLIPDFDMVVGARTGKSVHIPWIRRPAKWFLGKLAQYLSRRKIPDLNSGLRIMRKEVVDRFMSILPIGFSWTTTITLAMLVGGYRVKFVPIDYEKRKGRSKIRPIRDTLGFFGLIIRTVLYFNPLRAFARCCTSTRCVSSFQ
jgi:glycosyltransferase involved in cell wall biosynthesis